MSFTQIELLEAEIKILDDILKKNSLSLCNGKGKPCEQEIFSNPSSLNPNRMSNRLINKSSCDNCVQSKRSIILDTARKRNPLVARLKILKMAEKIRLEKNKEESKIIIIKPKTVIDDSIEKIDTKTVSKFGGISIILLGSLGYLLYYSKNMN